MKKKNSHEIKKLSVINKKINPIVKTLYVQLVDLKQIINIKTNSETLHFSANSIEKLKKIEFKMKSCNEKFRKSLIDGNLVNYKSYIWFLPMVQNKDSYILKYDRIKDELVDEMSKKLDW